MLESIIPKQSSEKFSPIYKVDVESFCAMGIITPPQFFISQNLVSLGKSLEALISIRVIWILIWMQTSGCQIVRSFDFFRAGFLGNAKKAIIVV